MSFRAESDAWLMGLLRAIVFTVLAGVFLVGLVVGAWVW